MVILGMERGRHTGRLIDSKAILGSFLKREQNVAFTYCSLLQLLARMMGPKKGRLRKQVVVIIIYIIFGLVATTHLSTGLKFLVSQNPCSFFSHVFCMSS